LKGPKAERTEEICVSHPLNGFVDVGDSSQSDLGVHRVNHPGDEPGRGGDDQLGRLRSKESVGTHFDSIGC